MSDEQKMSASFTVQLLSVGKVVRFSR